MRQNKHCFICLINVILLLLFSLAYADNYEKINIIGETAGLGVYDPSVEYDENGMGYLVYSLLEKLGYAHTHLAKSQDQGKTWTYIKTINLVAEDILNIKGKSIRGVWKHETASLVYDRYDPDHKRRWKLFWVKAFSKPPHLGAMSALKDFTLIMYKYAATCEDLSKASEIILFSAKDLSSPYTAKFNLNPLHPREDDFQFFMEPGAIALKGSLYLALHGVSDKPDKAELFLLSSDDYAKNWKFVATLTSSLDAQQLGFDVLTAPSIVEIHGRVFLLATPAKIILSPLPRLSYQGVYIFEFEDISKGILKRDPKGRLLVTKHIKASSTKSIGGGQSDYDSGNTFGGVIMSQSVPLARKERFTILNTQEQILEENR